MKLRLIISTFIIGFISFSFSIKDDDEIERVIIKMNEFYLTNSVSMTSSVEYLKKDGSTEHLPSLDIQLFEGNYFCSSSEELHMKNSSLYLNINMNSKVICIYKMPKQDPNILKSEIAKEWLEHLEQYIDKKITSDNESYFITFYEFDKSTTLHISKKDFSLIKFSCEFLNDQTYKSVTVNYNTIKVGDNDLSLFNENKYIKKSNNKYVGSKTYKGYKIIDKTTK